MNSQTNFTSKLCLLLLALSLVGCTGLSSAKSALTSSASSSSITPSTSTTPNDPRLPGIPSAPMPMPSTDPSAVPVAAPGTLPSVGNSTTLASGNSVSGWPDAIQCTASNGQFVNLPIWVKGASGTTTYGSPSNSVAFDPTKTISSVQANSAALSSSNCQVGVVLSAVRSFTFTKTTTPLVSGFADGLICEKANGEFMVLLNWIRGAAGNVAYGTPNANIVFNSSGILTSIVGNYDAVAGSSCAIGSSISNLKTFNLTLVTSAQSMVSAFPDLIMCKTSNNQYVILTNFIRGAGGNVAYGNADVNVAFNSNNQISNITGNYSALSGSNCALGTSISSLAQANVVDSISAPTTATTTSNLPPLAQIPLLVDDNSNMILMEYEAWFTPNHSFASIAPAYSPLLKSSGLTTGYNSNDPAIIHQHIQWLEAMGVDAVTAEESNGGPCDSTFSTAAICTAMLNRTNGNSNNQSAFSTQITSINQSTLNLYDAFASQGTLLKIVPLVDGQDQEMFANTGSSSTPFDNQIQQYVQKMNKYPQLNVIYKGLPLLMVFLGAGQNPSDPNSAFSLSTKAIAKYKNQLTIRLMAGFLESQPAMWASPNAGLGGLHPVNPAYPLWSWVDRFNAATGLVPSYTTSGSVVEAFTASLATPGTTGANGGWGASDVSLWNGGSTFHNFMVSAEQINPTFLIVDQFNEYAQPDQGVDEQHSNDIEPTAQWGYDKYNAIKGALLSYRSWFQARDAKVIGVIDSINQGVIRGWACERYNTASLKIQVYLGGAAGAGGTLATTANATVTSEPAIAQNCHGNATAYRFTATLSADTLAKAAGQSVFVYGVSPSGGASLPLTNSGAFALH